MSLNLEKYIINTKISKLYHSTGIRNEKMQEHFDEVVEYNPEYILPEWNDYSRDLDHEKFFTVTSGCTYSFYGDWVFLEYSVIKPLRLFDMYNYGKDYGYGEIDINLRNKHRNKLIELLKSTKLDGYVDREDCVEVCLFRPKEAVGEHKIITPGECEMNHEYERSMLEKSY